jgi:hypothetical protein
MLSQDELINGIPFILKLWDAAGTPCQWVQTLRGDKARRWYDIYRNSDWDALRREAAETFLRPVTEEEAEKARRGHRCIVIKTERVKAEELLTVRGDTETTGASDGAALPAI